MQFLQNIKNICSTPYDLISVYEHAEYDNIRNFNCCISGDQLGRYAIRLMCTGGDEHYANYQQLANREVRLFCPLPQCRMAIFPEKVSLFARHERMVERMVGNDNIIEQQVCYRRISIEEHPKAELVAFVQSRFNRFIAVTVNTMHWISFATSLLIHKTAKVASAAFIFVKTIFVDVVVAGLVNYLIRATVGVVISPIAVPYIFFGRGEFRGFIVDEVDPTQVDRARRVFNCINACVPNKAFLGKCLNIALVIGAVWLVVLSTANFLILAEAVKITAFAISIGFLINTQQQRLDLIPMKKPPITPAGILNYSPEVRPRPICRYRTPESEQRANQMRDPSDAGNQLGAIQEVEISAQADPDMENARITWRPTNNAERVLNLLAYDVVWDFPELNNE